MLDPFMGGGSTIAAAIAVGSESIGIELDPGFFEVVSAAIPTLFELDDRRDDRLHRGKPKAAGKIKQGMLAFRSDT